MSLLNLAEWESGVTTLGPGLRTVLWVQGCLQRCSECCSPEWQPLRPALLVEPAECARVIATQSADGGLTISGGEPMLQAAGLVELWRAVSSLRPDWTLLLFSGYDHEQLLEEGHPDKLALLCSADAFIGGPYIAAMNKGAGLRGSINKEVWLPSYTRFTAEDAAAIANGPRSVQYRKRSDGILAVGVP